jgi:DNA-binding winged helix-turn-helix (wHTH) protein/tetratricopeptide (TPR) repeat protein
VEGKMTGLKSSSDSSQIRAETPSTIEIGPYRLDAVARTLRRGSSPVPLGPKLFQLLLVLAENRGRVVSRAELLRRIWPEAEPSPGSLHQSISALRKTLGTNADGSELIENVQRRGYRLCLASARPGVPAAARLRAVLAILGVALGASLLAAFGIARTSRKTPRAFGVAVLPLSSPSDPQLGVRLAEALALRLGEAPGVSVRASRGARDGTALDEGRSLGVDYVIDGSVRGAPGARDAFVSVLGVSNGTRQWSEARGASLLELERTLSREVIGLLPMDPGWLERRRLLRAETADTSALEALLDGRRALGDSAGLTEAAAFFRRATERDPRWARARAGLAEAELALVLSGEAPALGGKALEDARRAVELDDSLADAHLALGTAQETHELAFEAAEKNYRRALDERPNDVTALCRLGKLYGETGRIAESISQLRRARELAPRSVVASSLLAFALGQDGQRVEALEECRRARSLDPSSPWPPFYAGLFDVVFDRREEAAAEFGEAARLSRDPAFEASRAYGLARLGRRPEAEAALRALENRGVSAYHVALVKEALGDRDSAIALLNRAVAERSPWLPFLACDTRAFPLRGDPRFAAILRTAGLEKAFIVTP